MHKFFAKPLFLGKKVVFLPQCHSSNEELVSMARNSSIQEGTVLYTDDQTKGKGQRGNAWLSEAGKNILMSFLLRPAFLLPTDQFYLNLIAGLAIIDTLKRYAEGQLLLKWPNDIYLNEKKVSGILIESNMRGSKLESSVVGVGLNVNQRWFELPNATSLFMEEEKSFDRMEVLESILIDFEKWYLKLKSGNKGDILDSYHRVLMWRGEKRSFRANNEEFQGEIIGVNNQGQLTINVGEKLKYFGIKEVKFLM